jgi:hypothetical protein
MAEKRCKDTTIEHFLQHKKKKTFPFWTTFYYPKTEKFSISFCIYLIFRHLFPWIKEKVFQNGLPPPFRTEPQWFRMPIHTNGYPNTSILHDSIDFWHLFCVKFSSLEHASGY